LPAATAPPGQAHDTGRVRIDCAGRAQQLLPHPRVSPQPD